MGRVDLDRVRQFEQLSVDRLVKPSSQLRSNPASQQVQPGSAAQQQRLSGENRSDFPLLFHHEGDGLRRMAGSVEDSQLELPQVERVVVLQADRGIKQSSGCAGAYLASGLGC